MSISSVNKKYKHGIFLFHRDLRLTDNRGLIDLCRRCEKVYTCFIFTPDQVGSANKYKSDNAIQFMIESLMELSDDIKSRGGELITLYGATFPTLKSLIDHLGVEVVAYNRDYSPYAMRRDKEIRTRCISIGIDSIESSDYYLYEPGEIGSGKIASPPYNKDQQKPYQKYTPFYDNVLGNKIEEPLAFSSTGRLAKPTNKSFASSLSLKDALRRFVNNDARTNENILVRGGRKEALSRFRKATTGQDRYSSNRDQFNYETTFLSAYIKFGCLSIREVYHGFKRGHGLRSGLMRELIWREFFAHVLYGFPQVLDGSYIEKYRRIKWRNSSHFFERWKRGMTGFPIVDASMRQLNATGYMHNRGRMVVATFLTKTLLLNWRLGEMYFAQQLTDYDPASNNGNWQSIASTGVDGKPYFRDMNPWIQSAKFDADAEFIKKWVPELREVLPKDIHHWDSKFADYKGKVGGYPGPMVDYSEQKPAMIRLYREA